MTLLKKPILSKLKLTEEDIPSASALATEPKEKQKKKVQVAFGQFLLLFDSLF